MKAKLLLLMTLALMGWSNVWATDYTTATTDGISFQFSSSDNSTAIITGVTFGANVTSLTIPATVKSNADPYTTFTVEGVSGVGTNAISGSESASAITSLTISEGIFSIYSWAFANWTGLTSISLPSTLKSIGNTAFGGCTGITSLDLSGTAVSSIGEYAFQGCSNITGISFPSTLTTIYSNAFINCSKITSLDLSGTSVSSIGEHAFENCSKIEWIKYPATLNSIGANGFFGCESLTKITSYSNSISLGADVFKCSGSEVDQYNKIPKNCVLQVPDGKTLTYAANSGGGSGTWSYWDAFYSEHNIHELSNVTITTAGWGTYYNDYGYTMPVGVEGYIITSTSGAGTTANLVKVYDPGQEVVANIALLWKSTETLTETKTFTVEALSSGGNTAEWPKLGETAYFNLLKGSQTGETTHAGTAPSSDYYYYKLAQNKDSGLGWYWGAAEGAAFTSGAHKAWLIVSKTGAGARSFVGFDLDGTTAIESVVKKAEINDGVYYNLQGLRVDNPTKGLYIVNGKTVVIK